MATKFDSNTFEDDYVLAVLSHLVVELKTDKSREQILDKYAVELTAFMNGRTIEAVRNSTWLGYAPRHPTIEECHASGAGPTITAKGYSEGGLPNDSEERARFEAYMRGHCWDVGNFDAAINSYDTLSTRCLYGVWRDRGSLPTVWPNG